MFIQEIIYLKKWWGICNKSWWVEESWGTHWIAFYVNSKNRKASEVAIYIDSFGVEYIPKEISKFIGNNKYL